MADEFVNDPNKGIPISELIKRHGGFTAVVEKKDWFDPVSKPRKKKSDVNFDPDEKGENDGDVQLPEPKVG